MDMMLVVYLGAFVLIGITAAVLVYITKKYK